MKKKYILFFLCLTVWLKVCAVGENVALQAITNLKIHLDPVLQRLEVLLNSINQEDTKKELNDTVIALKTNLRQAHHANLLPEISSFLKDFTKKDQWGKDKLDRLTDSLKDVSKSSDVIVDKIVLQVIPEIQEIRKEFTDIIQEVEQTREMARKLPYVFRDSIKPLINNLLIGGYGFGMLGLNAYAYLIKNIDVKKIIKANAALGLPAGLLTYYLSRNLTKNNKPIIPAEIPQRITVRNRRASI